jgi:nucleoside-diphosphate-sugar epimerase
MAETLLVTGGGGFLGMALIKALLSRGYKIKTINRGHYPDLESLGITVLRGDLADYNTARNAVQGCEAVFHVAAKPGVWGPYSEYFDANVRATMNILKACREAGVRRLVYTSSPSVTFAGQNQENVDETTPYPKRYLAAYPETKAMAEKLVLEANDQELATVSLRPHLIWGPGDRHLIPRVIDRAKRGRLRLIGRPGKLVDAVYIDNAVDAHIQALLKLGIGSPISGRAYFIGNQEPVRMDDMINGILAAARLPPLTARISFRLAMILSSAFEAIFRWLRLKREPPLTRFIVLQMSTSHWFNPRAAREELGYEPRVSMEEGFQRLERSLAETKAIRP